MNTKCAILILPRLLIFEKKPKLNGIGREHARIFHFKLLSKTNGKITCMADEKKTVHNM